MMMVICAELLLFLAVIISKSEYHAFRVSIQTNDSLPVIGEDFTLICTFTPETKNRRLIWSNGNNVTVASHSCDPYSTCTWATVPDRSKFSLIADTGSGNLTLKQININDSSNYQCRVSSKYGAEITGSTSFQVQPLSPIPPYLVRISDENLSRYYHNNTNITVTAGEPYNITCAAYGARPPAVLEWRIPDDVAVVLQDQANVVQGYSYISLKTATITPSRDDQGKYLRCLASHPKLQHHLQRSVYLNVHDDPVVFMSFQRLTSNTSSTGFVLTCTSDANPPAYIFQWLCNGTQFSNETCNITFSETIIEGETLTSSQVVIRNPLSEDPCDLKCIAVSSNGSGSAVFNFTSVQVSIDPDVNTALVTFGRDLCTKPANVTASPGLSDPPFTRRKTYVMTIALGVIASAGFTLVISLGLMYFYGTLCCVKRRKDNGDNTQPEGRMVDDDGLVYVYVSHDHAHSPNAPPIQTEEPTVYASLNPEVTQRRKGEMEDADTKATTPDGQPMYGNYLVKKRNRQEQARMPPPVQTYDATYNAEGMDCRKGGMKGDIGPTTLDDPMYANYFAKMRKDEERAKQIASTHDAFEMYGI